MGKPSLKCVLNLEYLNSSEQRLHTGVTVFWQLDCIIILEPNAEAFKTLLKPFLISSVTFKRIRFPVLRKIKTVGHIDGSDVFAKRAAGPYTGQFAVRSIFRPTDLLIWVIQQPSCVVPIMEDKAYLWLQKLPRSNGKMSSFDKIV